MAIYYSPTVRNARMTAVVTDAGANAQIKLYNGTRPAAGGALSGNTLIAELVAGTTLGTVSGGVLTFGTITGDTSANNGGTPTWARVFKSDGTTIVFDFDISSFPVCTAGQPVDITSLTVTEGNAS